MSAWGSRIAYYAQRLGGSLALAIGLGACGNIVIDNHCECGFFADGDQRPLIWPKGKREIVFYAHNSVPKGAIPAMSKALSIYQDALAPAGVSATFVSDSTDNPLHGGASLPERVQGDGRNGVYWVDGVWPFASESGDHESGMTLILFSRNGIVEADVFVRGASFSSYLAGEAAAAPRVFDAESASYDEQLLYLLMVHEYGHAFGRNHAHDHESSIMRPVVLFENLAAPLTEFDLNLLFGAYDR